MNAPDNLPVAVGDVIADKYRVDRVIGAGGMGVVVQATHLQLEQRVAIKFLLPDAASSPEVVQRFAREARAAARVQNEHIVRVMDVATLPSGAPYMVMEYLEGGDLSELISDKGALPVEEAVGYLLQACEAVGEAHAAGIVHRDLKPANLFLARKADRPAVVKVLDFGISKAMDSGTGPSASLTRTSAVMGSPLYMSPEQMKSTRSVDTRADIWALGVILYESLTGRVPFEAETMPELCARVLTEPPRPIRELRPDLPPPLVDALDRCLNKDRERRFQTVAELAAAVAAFAPMGSNTIPGAFRHSSAGSIPPGRNPSGSTRAQGSTGVAWGQTAGDEPPKRRAGLWIGIAAVLLVAAAASGVVLLRPHGETMPTQALVPSSSAPAVDTSAPSASVATSAPAPSASSAPSPTAEVPAKTAPAKTAGGKSTSKSTAEPTAQATPAETTPPPPTATTPPKPAPTSPLNINLK